MLEAGGEEVGIGEEAREESDRQEMQKLLREVELGAQETRKGVQSLIEDLREGERNEGISFLDIKNRVLASYISNLGFLMLKKCYGQGLEEESAVDRLVENRTVLEKMRSIDQKLRYQVDKLVNIAENGAIDASDPLRFKPNPDGLMSKLDEEDDDGEEEDDAGENAAHNKTDVAKYRPAMNVPQYFNDGRPEERQLEEGERKKKKALSRSIMESIKEQYLDAPEEVHHKADTMRSKYIEDERERTRIEEENFIRLPVTKEDRMRRKSMMTMGTMGDDLTAFGKSFYDDADRSQPSKTGKKRKAAAGGKKKGGKKFKKKRH